MRARSIRPRSTIAARSSGRRLCQKTPPARPTGVRTAALMSMHHSPCQTQIDLPLLGALSCRTTTVTGQRPNHQRHQPGKVAYSRRWKEDSNPLPVRQVESRKERQTDRRRQRNPSYINSISGLRACPEHSERDEREAGTHKIKP